MSTLVRIVPQQTFATIKTLCDGIGIFFFLSLQDLENDRKSMTPLLLRSHYQVEFLGHSSIIIFWILCKFIWAFDQLTK